MNEKTEKLLSILLIVFLVLVLASSTGFYFWNKMYQQEENIKNQGQFLGTQQNTQEKMTDATAKIFFKATEIIANDLPASISFSTQEYCPNSGTNEDYLIPEGYNLENCAYFQEYKEEENGTFDVQRYTTIVLIKNEFTKNIYTSAEDYCKKYSDEATTEITDSNTAEKLIVGDCHIVGGEYSELFVLQGDDGNFKKIIGGPVAFLEYPKIVDIDNDKISEIVFGEDIFLGNGLGRKITSSLFSLKEKQFFEITLTKFYTSYKDNVLFDPPKVATLVSKNLDLTKYKNINDYLKNFYENLLTKAYEQNGN